MKLKKILTMTIILLAILTISAVSAAENNMTTDIVQLEDSQMNDEIGIKKNNSDILAQDKSIEEIGAANDSSQCEPILSTTITRDKLETSSNDVILKQEITEKPLTSSRTYTITYKVKVSNHWYTSKTLKTGDCLLTAATSKNGQHGRSVTIGTMIDAGQEGQHSTKLIKAKVWFKNTKTGKIITRTKTSTNNYYNIKKFSWINGYKPYKAKVWYKFR